MPVPLLAEQLASSLRQYRLLEPEQLAEFEHLRSNGWEDVKLLAKELVQRGWLTTYQVNQLFLGRGQDLLLGSYVLLEKLGEGGMGQVFKARNWKLGQIVALKLVLKERLDNPDAIRRFHREIRAAAQLDHPNIVRAFDADEVNGVHLLVMEYVDGTDLAKLVKQQGPLPVPTACEYLRQAALGLQHAFERGMVHRDIKPHNLLLTLSREPAASAENTLAAGSRLNGVVKILDMGLARLTRPVGDAEASSTMTQDGTVVGTPDYIAPEQALESHGVDIRADLYSLGCTLYFLLTGRVPFPGGTLLQKLNKHQFQEPTPLLQLRTDVSPRVVALVGKLMAKRPEQRYQTPAELAAALQELGQAQAAPVAKRVDFASAAHGGRGGFRLSGR